MHSELLNVYLFACAIGKSALMIGAAPGLALAFFGPRCAKYYRPVKIGALVRIEGYHTGDFIGTVETVQRDVAGIRVTDPLRPMPRVKNRCSFPECVRADFHSGEHEFMRVRIGVLIEVWWANARFVPIKLGTGAHRPEQSEPGQMRGSNPRGVSDFLSASPNSVSRIRRSA